MSQASTPRGSRPGTPRSGSPLEGVAKRPRRDSGSASTHESETSDVAQWITAVIPDTTSTLIPPHGYVPETASEPGTLVPPPGYVPDPAPTEVPQLEPVPSVVGTTYDAFGGGGQPDGTETHVSDPGYITEHGVDLKLNNFVRNEIFNTEFAALTAAVGQVASDLGEKSDHFLKQVDDLRQFVGEHVSDQTAAMYVDTTTSHDLALKQSQDTLLMLNNHIAEQQKNDQAIWIRLEQLAKRIEDLGTVVTATPPTADVSPQFAEQLNRLS